MDWFDIIDGRSATSASNPCFQSFMEIHDGGISVHGWQYTRRVSILTIIILIRENNHNFCQYKITR
jgi:hypothetical protein